MDKLCCELWKSLLASFAQLNGIGTYQLNSDLANQLDHELRGLIASRKVSSLFIPDEWLKLEHDSKPTDDSFKRLLIIYFLTKPLFEKRFEKLNSAEIQDTFNFVTSLVDVGSDTSHNSYLFDFMVEYLTSNEIERSIDQSLINKARVVKLLYGHVALSQSQMRKKLGIAVQYRSNFRKVEIHPLLVNNIVEEFLITSNKRPYYRLTTQFKNALKIDIDKTEISRSNGSRSFLNASKGSTATVESSVTNF